MGALCKLDSLAKRKNRTGTGKGMLGVIENILLENENAATEADRDHIQPDSNSSPQMDLKKCSAKPHALWAIAESHK
jgi:hypothetical protein